MPPRRIRGGRGERGGAHVTIDNCALYDSEVGLHIESRPQNLKIQRLGIERPLKVPGSGSKSDYKNLDLYTAPPFEEVREKGLRQAVD